jgi:hypothetical protein
MAAPKRSTRKDNAAKPRRPSDIDESEERDPDQAWYWTKEWQEAERQVDEDLSAGQYKIFDTMEEFLADLNSEDDD